ncbi:MAG: DUF445 family protein, partial [Spirochaetaceae bacterium]|nr:DUF445 family protein [Spirochaetaceae bacterium]
REKIAHNVKTLIEAIPFNDIKHDVYKTIDTAFYLIDWEEVFATLKDVLGGMSIGNILGQSRFIPPEISARLVDFMRSGEGRAAAVQLLEAVFNEAAAVKVLLCEIIDSETEAAVVRFVQQSLNSILDDICLLIRGSTDEIEMLINETVDSQLSTSRWGTVLKSFKDLYTGNFAAETQIVSEIIASITESRSALIDASAKIIHSFIHERTAGGAFSFLAEKGGFNAENTVLYAENILCGMAEKGIAVPDGLYSAKISGFVNINFSGIKDKIYHFITHTASEYIGREETWKKLASAAEKTIRDFGRDSGGTGDGGADWERPALFLESPASAEMFGKAAGGGIEKLKQSARVKNGLLQTKPFGFLNSIFSNGQGLINWDGLWQKIRQVKLKNIYKKIHQKNTFEKIADITTALILENLELIVSGNVSKLVYQQLSKFTPTQVNVLVQDFMGKELKPINIFGAVMGAAAGVLSVFVFSFFNIFNNDTGLNLLTIFLYCIIFAGVGIGTNALAIRMLFRPYKKFLFNVPPFIGVAALRKPEFAKNIADFVRKGVLSKKSLQAVFTDNAGLIQQNAAGFLQAGNYAILDALLNNAHKQEKISAFIFNQLKSALTGNAEKIAERLFNALASAQTAAASAEHTEGADDTVARMLAGAALGGAAEQAVCGWAKNATEKKLTALSPFLRTVLGPQLGKQYAAAVSAIDAQTCAAFLSGQNRRFMVFAARHSLAGLFDGSLNSTLAEAGTAAIVRAAPQAFAKGAADFWDKNLSPQVQMSVLCGPILEKNLDTILRILQNALWAKRHSITERILERLHFAVRAAAGRQITEVVNTLIKDKLPVFMCAKRNRISAIVHKPLEQSYAQAGLARLGVCREKITAQADFIFASDAARKYIKIYTEKLAKTYTEIPLERLLAMLNIRHIDGLLKIIRPGLPVCIKSLCRAFTGETFVKYALDSVFNILEKTMSDIQIAALLDGLDTEKITARFFNVLRGNSHFNLILQDMVSKYIKIIFLEKNIINKHIFIDDIHNFLRSIDNGSWNKLEYINKKYISLLCRHLNADINTEAKDALLCGMLLDSIFEAFREHGQSIINAVDIKAVVEKEINKMSPKEIENLFYQFAGRYFTKIIFYGWIGAAGGLMSLLLR